MSQKRLKKIRKIQMNSLAKEEKIGLFTGIREIIKENWIFLLVLGVSILVLYFNALRGDFVSDDYATITQDPEVANVAKSLTAGNLPTFYKSVLAASFGVGNSFPFHLGSVLIYILVCYAAFIFLRLIFDKKTAILTIILFACLPIHVEAVTWISGIPYLLSAFFMLISLTLFALFLGSANKKYLWFLLPSLFFLFWAERYRGVSVFLLIFIYLASFDEKLKLKINLWKVIISVFVVVTLVLIFSWPLIVDRVNSVNGGYNGYGGIFYSPFFQYPTSITKYLQLIFFPADLTLYHTMYIIPAWLNWIILLVYLLAVGYFFIKDKKLFFALSFIFLASAASMMPVKVSWLVAERYLFLGSLGFCLFLVLFFQKFDKKWKVPLYVLYILLIVVYSLRSFLRNIDWQTNHKLWVNTCQVSPNSHNAWNNIGDDYDKLAQLEATEEGKKNQYFNSVKGFTQSVVVKNNYADAYHNRANIFYKMGRYDLARQSYETALSYGPNLYQSYFSLLQIDILEKDYQKAIDHLNRLNTVRPNDPQVYYAASIVYANMGQLEQSISILEQLVKANPNWKQAVDMLGQVKAIKLSEGVAK